MEQKIGQKCLHLWEHEHYTFHEPLKLYFGRPSRSPFDHRALPM